MTTTQEEEIKIYSTNSEPQTNVPFSFQKGEDLEGNSAKVLRALSRDDSTYRIEFTSFHTPPIPTDSWTTTPRRSPLLATVSRTSSTSSSLSSPLDQLAELASLESPSPSSYSQSDTTSRARSIIQHRSYTLLPPLPRKNPVNVSGSNDAIITHILENDVLCGRGGLTNHHTGNIKFRQLVRLMQPAYLLACKRNKAKIAKLIVDTIRTKFLPPGRFLRRQDSTSLNYSGINNEQLKWGIWVDIGDTKAREKTSQALREGAPIIREDVVASASGMSGGQESLILGSGNGDNDTISLNSDNCAVSKEHVEYMRYQYSKILAQSDCNNNTLESTNQHQRQVKRRRESTNQ